MSQYLISCTLSPRKIKAELRGHDTQEGRSKKSVPECLAFLPVCGDAGRVCENGVQCSLAGGGPLGSSAMGAHVFVHADVAVAAATTMWPYAQQITIIMLKVRNYMCGLQVLFIILSISRSFVIVLLSVSYIFKKCDMNVTLLRRMWALGAHLALLRGMVQKGLIDCLTASLLEVVPISYGSEVPKLLWHCPFYDHRHYALMPLTERAKGIVFSGCPSVCAVFVFSDRRIEFVPNI